MTAHDDRARDERQAADELTAHDQEQGHYESSRGTYGDGTLSYPGDPGREHEQPAPTARETAADEQAPFESDVPCTCETGACIAADPTPWPRPVVELALTAALREVDRQEAHADEERRQRMLEDYR